MVPSFIKLDDSSFILEIEVFFTLFLFIFMEMLCPPGPLIYILIGPYINLNNLSLTSFKKKIHGEVNASENANLTKDALPSHNCNLHVTYGIKKIHKALSNDSQL